MSLTRGRLRHVYDVLYRAYGPQGWWPARSHFEMMTGAVLVQNTNWANAALAIAALKQARLLSPAKIASLPPARLAKLIRSSGTHRVKAGRLQALSRWLLEQGGIARARRLGTDELRRSLLAVHGVGSETADCILVYVFSRPLFIADAYARRLLGRLGFEFDPDSYESIRLKVQSLLPADAALYNEFHALIVRHSKGLCRTKPRCEECPLRRGCAYGRAGNHPKRPL